MGPSGIPVLAVIVSVLAWLLMLAVGVLHSAGIADTTIGFDEAMGLSLCFVPAIVLLMTVHAVLVARAIRIAAVSDGEDA